MIFQIYNGKTRGFGGTDEGGWIKMGFDFRRYMHYFKGAKFSVLMCLILHSNEKGISFPSFTTIQEETGYNRQAISKAIITLCNTTIENQRILLRYHSNLSPRNFKRNNQYIVFPSEVEIRKYDRYENHTIHQYENHTDNGMKIILEVEPIEEPLLSRTNLNNILQQNSKKLKKKKSFEEMPGQIRSYDPGQDGIPGQLEKE